MVSGVLYIDSVIVTFVTCTHKMAENRILKPTIVLVVKIFHQIVTKRYQINEIQPKNDSFSMTNFLLKLEKCTISIFLFLSMISSI